jgi:hypothetical protein
MYALLFRSRWYAFAWAMMMALSAIAFTTTGLGAWLTGTEPNAKARAEAEARETRFRSWAEDEAIDEQGTDPSRPDKLRDGIQREDYRESEYNKVPYAGAESDSQESASSQ